LRVLESTHISVMMARHSAFTCLFRIQPRPALQRPQCTHQGESPLAQSSRPAESWELPRSWRPGVWAEIVVPPAQQRTGRRPHVRTVQLPFRGECHGAGRRAPDQHGHESIYSSTCRSLPGRRLPALRPSEPSQRATRSLPCWEGEGAAQGGVWGLGRLCQSPHFQ